MDSESSTPSGAGNAKKRKFSMGAGPNPLVSLELDAKNYEIQKLKELVQTLHERVSELEDEKESWNENKENEDVEPEQKIGGNDKKYQAENEKMILIVKEKEKKIVELEAQISLKSKTEEQLREKITELEKNVERLTTHNSKLIKEVRELKNKTQKSVGEAGLRTVTLDEIYTGSQINSDLLTSEHILNVEKLEAADINLWHLYSTEASEPFKMDIDVFYKKTQFKINLTGSLTCVDKENPDKINEVIQPIHSCNYENLYLGYQILDETAFKKLASDSVKSCKLQNISVKKYNGGFMSADEIFQMFPDVEDYEYCFKRYNHESLGNVPTNFSKLPRFDNLKKFKFSNATNKFDLETFGKFMIKHPDTAFIVQYHPLCENAQFKIQGIAEKLSQTCKISVEFAK